MKPEYVNGLSIFKNAQADGGLLELQMDFKLLYTEAETAIIKNEPVMVHVKKSETVSSILMSRVGVITFLKALYMCLGDEFDSFVTLIKDMD